MRRAVCHTEEFSCPSPNKSVDQSEASSLPHLGGGGGGGGGGEERAGAYLEYYCHVVRFGVVVAH